MPRLDTDDLTDVQRYNLLGYRRDQTTSMMEAVMLDEIIAHVDARLTRKERQYEAHGDKMKAAWRRKRDEKDAVA